MTRRIVDLSHPVVDGMTTYPGLPAPRISVHTDRAESAARLSGGVSFHIGQIDMVANTGTYLDAPFHYHADGADCATLPPERLVDVPAVVIRAVGRAYVDTHHLGEVGELWGRAVLVHTDWSRHWGSPDYLSGGPYLTGAAARALVEANVALVGIDSLNIDDNTDPTRPVHHRLLGAGIPIVEHLTNLDQLPDTGVRLTALPAPVRGMGTFPVRAVAVFG
jgi:Predicted metal-dependent hydrolase